MTWAKSLLYARRALGLLLALTLLTSCAGFTFNLGGEPVELTFVYLDQAADYAPLAEAFHDQHPNITITLDPVTLGRDTERVFAEKMAGADAIRYPVFGVNDEILNTFLPLDTQITTSSNFPINDFFPGSLEGLQMNGKQLGLPAGLIPYVVWYSPAKFSAAGVRPPPPNWTLEDFVTTAMAVHNADDATLSSPTFAYGFCSHGSLPDGAIFIYLFGGGLFDSLYQVSAPTLNRQENIDALSWYVSLKNDFGLLPDMERAQGVGQLVARSGCGFWMDWLDHSTFGSFGPEDSTPLPLPTYHKRFNVSTLDGYFILDHSLHPEEAWMWIEFLMNQQSASGRMIPPLQSAIDSLEYEQRASQPVLNVARSLPQETVILGLEMYRNQKFGAALELFSQASIQVFDGTTSAADALNSIQQQAEALFR
jgi:ABC-type glycerol-3-phosphate transport system substrate-binding protein